eukprot:TRINITY_DN5114_c0_g1_i1.p1 TRINITY_DN5114_c0_g1~~TRINITY_DN5114_c0_g1_i1.p1  ORF type:complete len:611 (-),score=202.59 TRINITY_DN5114_c0_g1_i1:46-1824(-)
MPPWAPQFRCFCRLSPAWTALLAALLGAASLPSASALAASGRSAGTSLRGGLGSAAKQEPPTGLAAPVAATAATAAAAAAASPAPAAPARPPPTRSETLQKAAAGLAAEHRLLSNISQELLSLGAEVDGTEQALLGRVLTVETARGLLDKHRQLQGANVWSREHLSDLREQAEALYVQLANVSQASNTADKARSEEKQRLEAEVAAQRSQLERLRTAASTLPGDQQRHAALERERGLAEGAGRQAHLDIHAELQRIAQARAEIKAEVEDEVKLEQMLLEEHQQAIKCHGEAERLQNELRAMVLEAPKTTAAEQAAMRHAENLAKASSQRLRAEGAILAAEVVRKEKSGREALVPLREEQTRLEALEQRLVAEVQNLTGRMNVSKDRTLMLQQEAQANVGKGDEASGRLRGLDEQIRGLHQRVSPVVYAAIQAENRALEEELKQATIMLMQSKTVEARSHAAASQMSAELEAQTEATRLVAETAEKAKEEGKRQVEVAVQQSAQARAKARALEEQAQSVIAERCQAQWDKRSSEKNAAVAECKQNREELSIVQAQRDMLQQTLQAKQTASAAAEGVDPTAAAGAADAAGAAGP